MLDQAEKERLSRLFAGRISFDVPLSQYTSWQVGGPADIFYQPETLEDLLQAVRELSANYPLQILGLGTNTLFADEGFRGAIFCLRRAFCHIQPEGENGSGVDLRVGCGTPLAKLYAHAKEHELSGMEWAYGVPGTIGGALRMNAGTFLGKVGDIVVEIRGIDENLKPMTWPRDKIVFDYRRSNLPENAFFVDALFRLHPGQAEQLAQTVEPLKLRKDRQPLAAATAGSTFKNPPGQSAAALIDGCGLKGLKHGAAMVSEQHANFIINCGGASANDILALIAEVRNQVQAKTGVLLEPEVRLVGVELA